MSFANLTSERAITTMVFAQVSYRQEDISRVGDGMHLAPELHQLQDISTGTIFRSLAHNLDDCASLAILQPVG